MNYPICLDITQLDGCIQTCEYDMTQLYGDYRMRMVEYYQ